MLWKYRVLLFVTLDQNGSVPSIKKKQKCTSIMKRSDHIYAQNTHTDTSKMGWIEGKKKKKVANINWNRNRTSVPANELCLKGGGGKADPMIGGIFGIERLSV